MSSARAWLLECGNSLAFAVGDHEMAEYVQQQDFYPVPGAPAYCQGVIVWQGNIVPVMDLATLHDRNASSGQNRSYLCIINYQPPPNTALQQLAVRVTRAPQKIIVDDEHACEIPEFVDASVLGQACLACFNRDELPVMIIDIARLCSAEFRELACAA